MPLAVPPPSSNAPEPRSRLAIAVFVALGVAIVVVPLALRMPDAPDAPASKTLHRESEALATCRAVLNGADGHALSDAAAATDEDLVLDDDFVSGSGAQTVGRDATSSGDKAETVEALAVWPPPLPAEALNPDGSTPQATATQPVVSTRPASAPGVTDGAPLSEFDRSADARARRVAQFGGNVNTESAVEAGLAWLAAHQEPDGIWSRVNFPRRCPDGDRCTGFAVNRRNINLDPGVTGMCLLAFLGAGYTDERGPYQRTISRAVDALLRMQQNEGGFGTDPAQAGYNDSIATLALAEYYEMTRAPGLEHVLERAALRLSRTQQLLGGWDYTPRADTGRNDTSITAWMVQALQACAVSGVPTPRGALIRASLHFSRAAQPDGQVWYADAGVGVRGDADDPTSSAYRYGPAMSAAGLACEQILGWSLDGPIAQRQRALILQQLPSGRLLTGGDKTQLHDYYYLYYGTAAMFQLGTEGWERWNANLRDTLLPLQDRSRTPKGDKKHSFGSWQPFGESWGRWGRSGSRIYATAISVLTLEIYYRHTPAYLEDRVVLTSADWREFLKGPPPRVRRQALAALRQTRLDVAEPVLAELIDDADAVVAAQASLGLADLNSPLGLATLEAAARTATVSEKPALERAARRCREILALPATEGMVRVVDYERKLTTLELPRAYVGMRLEASHAGRPVAKLRVIQRFSSTRIVVAVVEEGCDALSAGDKVVGS